MPEMHLQHPGFMETDCEPFTRKKKIKIQRNRRLEYIYQNKLDKSCFQDDMAYCAYKKLPRRTDSVKLLCDKAFIIASNPYYDGYQRVLP